MNIKSTSLPAIFLGHGSPMNAIEETEFNAGIQKISQEIPTPKAIVIFSAHWQTYNATYIGTSERPETLYDFRWFPEELYKQSYNAFWNPELAQKIIHAVSSTHILPASSRGLDHGVWSVLKFLYPQANIPVIPLSLNMSLGLEVHCQIAKELQFLREEGVLFVGSGNIVHNLMLLDWNRFEDNFAFPWAEKINSQVKSLLAAKNILGLMQLPYASTEAKVAISDIDHFIPLLYIIALAHEHESIDFFNDSIVWGSLSMTSFIVH